MSFIGKISKKFFLYKNSNDTKYIFIECIFSPFNILNMNLTISDINKNYVINFWFLFFEFYIVFHNIFKWYPKYYKPTNILIGIYQHNLNFKFSLWSDEYSDDKKRNGFLYKSIYLTDYINEKCEYHIIEEYDTKVKITLPEDTYEVKVKYKYWHLKYKYFFLRFFDKKGKTFIFYENNIKYPLKKITEDDKKILKEDPENYKYYELNMSTQIYKLKKHNNMNDAIELYKKDILKIREIDNDWTPYKYMKIKQIKNKLKRLT